VDPLLAGGSDGFLGLENSAEIAQTSRGGTHDICARRRRASLRQGNGNFLIGKVDPEGFPVHDAVHGIEDRLRLSGQTRLEDLYVLRSTRDLDT
jgi:hypothetical protein